VGGITFSGQETAMDWAWIYLLPNTYQCILGMVHAIHKGTDLLLTTVFWAGLKERKGQEGCTKGGNSADAQCNFLSVQCNFLAAGEEGASLPGPHPLAEKDSGLTLASKHQHTKLASKA
jgi:hypothetical protein